MVFWNCKIGVKVERIIYLKRHSFVELFRDNVCSFCALFVTKVKTCLTIQYFRLWWSLLKEIFSTNSRHRGLFQSAHIILICSHFWVKVLIGEGLVFWNCKIGVERIIYLKRHSFVELLRANICSFCALFVIQAEACLKHTILLGVV